ncbi:MAG: hypothetical protein PV344_03580 [Anaplasma sp.]|nr:hypothetical protein [Anaplasma sp.]
MMIAVEFFGFRRFQKTPFGGCFAGLLVVYCKRLNFREDLIFANRVRFAKNRSREQFGAICQY